MSAARKLSSAGVRVSVLEVAPASDRSQRALLESIAQSGQGVAVRLVADNTDIQRLNAPFERWVARSQSETSETQRVADQWRDLGPWLLLPVALIVSLMFRRGWMLQSALLAAGIQGGILLFPQPAAALDWSSWWKNNDQRQWQAVQAYREGDMQTALQSFAEDPGARGAYNRGNVMAKTGQLQEALAAYDEALRLQPDFEDAEYNRKLVEEALREQQQQQQAQQESCHG